MKFWINSNSGDVISEKDGVYTLILIHRYDNGCVLPSEIIKLTKSQFLAIKGFVPIKRKKIKSRANFKKYAPTLPDGSKGESKRVQVPTKSEARQMVLNLILN